MWHVSSSRPGAVVRQVRAASGQVFLRLSNGQVTLATLVAGIPVVTVVTTGARTGRTRTTPLLGVPFQATLPSSGLTSGKRARPAGITISGPTGGPGLYRTRARRLLPARCRRAAAGNLGADPTRSMAAIVAYARRIETGRSISCCSARQLRRRRTGWACSTRRRIRSGRPGPCVFTGRVCRLTTHACRSGDGARRMLLTSRHALPPALLGDTTEISDLRRRWLGARSPRRPPIWPIWLTQGFPR